MAKKFVSLLAAMTAIGGGATLFAQGGAVPTKATEGTLMVQDKNYPLTHGLAYETTINDEDVITVVLSGQTVSSEKLEEAREAEKEGNDSD
jgi:Flp pilus assembly secretin CpaC